MRITEQFLNPGNQLVPFLGRQDALRHEPVDHRDVLICRGAGANHAGIQSHNRAMSQ
jgi:hypothetical protein